MDRGKDPDSVRKTEGQRGIHIGVSGPWDRTFGSLSLHSYNRSGGPRGLGPLTRVCCQDKGQKPVYDRDRVEIGGTVMNRSHYRVGNRTSLGWHWGRLCGSTRVRRPPYTKVVVRLETERVSFVLLTQVPH